MPYLDISLRLLIAAILGGVIGWERERDNHPAGFRTHILVSVGSALIMLVSAYGFQEFMNEENVRFDPSRVGAQVVSGIGFLGAGAIVRQGLTVNGLTTAATLWVVAGIGLAVGSGFIYGAILTTILVFISLELLKRFDYFFRAKGNMQIYSLKLDGKLVTVGQIAALINQKGIEIRRLRVVQDEDSRWVNMKLFVYLSGSASASEILEQLRTIEGVVSIQTNDLLYEKENEEPK